MQPPWAAACNGQQDTFTTAQSPSRSPSFDPMTMQFRLPRSRTTPFPRTHRSTVSTSTHPFAYESTNLWLCTTKYHLLICEVRSQPQMPHTAYLQPYTNMQCRGNRGIYVQLVSASKLPTFFPDRNKKVMSPHPVLVPAFRPSASRAMSQNQRQAPATHCSGFIFR